MVDDFFAPNAHYAHTTHGVAGIATRVAPLLEWEAQKCIDAAVKPLLAELADLRNKCTKKDQELDEAKVSIRRMGADAENKLVVVKQERDEAKQERDEAKQELVVSEGVHKRLVHRCAVVRRDRDNVKRSLAAAEEAHDIVKQVLDDFQGRFHETILPVSFRVCNLCSTPVEDGKVGVLDGCGAVRY
jgi:chromosome segregation ATPase